MPHCVIAPKTRWPLAQLLQRLLLGKGGVIGEENVEHPGVEGLHHCQSVAWDCVVVLARSHWLVPAHISLMECMTMMSMDTKSTVPCTAVLNFQFDLEINFGMEYPASQGFAKQRRL